YPPLALGLFTLPRLVGESFRWYYVWFEVEIVAFDLIIVLALYFAAQRRGLPAALVLIGYTVAIIAVGPIALQQFDIVPALFALVAMIAYAGDLIAFAAAMLALGAMTKIYPVLLAPLFVLLEIRRGRGRALWRPVVAFAVTCLVLLTPWLIKAPLSLAVLIDYHAKRGIQIESTYATVALAAASLNLTIVRVVDSFGSVNLDGPLPRGLASASTAVLVVAMIVVYRAIDNAVRVDTGRKGRDLELLSQASLAVLAAAMVASKVLSPQYLVWLTPFVALVSARRRRVIWSLFAAVGVLTYFMYPHHYDDLLGRQPYAIAVMAGRNVLLLSLATVAARTLGRSESERPSVG
ncbi:MAG TPA: hypothetical protein VHV78_12325, partial [Gemmatimonadaceae bacterium]|nr:hypothetical protein [Gemmatimonadaceae bacterium]